MTTPSPAEILILAATAAAPRARALADALAPRGFAAEIVVAKAGDEAPPDLAARVAGARAVVLIVDDGLARSERGGTGPLTRALAGAGDRLTLVAVDRAAVGAIALPQADALPSRGSLADLSARDAGRLLRELAQEIAAEADASYVAQPSSAFDEYKLLVESTERQVDRRKATTPTFLAVNAAISGLITFVGKDLSLGRARLALVAAPLFVVGMLACRLWGRTLRQYEALIDWRYRQIRRMERRGLSGGYRVFSREWEALYAPRARAAFGFSSLEVAVAGVFLGLYGAGLVFVLAYAAVTALSR